MYQIAMLVAGLFLTGVLAMFVLSLSASRPQNLGVHDGRLAAPPGTPNCVSTQTDDRTYWMAPLEYSGSAELAWRTLQQVVAEVPRATVVSDDGGYMHVEVSTAVFRFTDDVEFLLDADGGRIHFRSASRVGHSDLGANRNRMDRVREQFGRRMKGRN